MRTPHRRLFLVFLCTLLLFGVAATSFAADAQDNSLTNLSRLSGVEATCVSDNGKSANYGYTHEPEYAIDGVDRLSAATLEFYQAAESNPLASLQIDLKSKYYIKKVSLNCSSNNYAKQFDLEVSSNGTDWKVVRNVKLDQAPSATAYFEYEMNVSARYVRIHVKENGGQYPATFFEVQIWGRDEEDSSVETDLALGGIASMDYPCYNSPSHPAAHAIDGNYNSSTYAQSASADAPWSLTVDLQKMCSISRVKLETSQKNHAKAFAIEISNDGKKWDALDTVTDFQGGVYEKQLSAPARCRWIRMHVTAVQTDGWGHTLFYFSAYGHAEPVVETIDLALNGSASMDNPCYMNPPHPAENAIDGNYNSTTYVQSASADAPWSLTVDLNTMCNINSIKLEASKKNHAKNFTIEASVDGETWETLDTVTNFAGGLYEKNLDSPIQAQWLRMHVTSVETDGYGHTLFYFSAYGSYIQPGTDGADFGTPIDNQGFIVTSSPARGNHVIACAFDGDENSFWEPENASEASITIDLRDYYDFSGIVIDGTISSPGLIKIDTSEDNIRWYQDCKALMTESGSSKLYVQNYRRYLRLTFPANISSLEVRNICLYGKRSADLKKLTINGSEKETHPILLPLPTSVPQVAVPVTDLNGTWQFSLEPKSGYWQDGSSRNNWTNVKLPGDAFAQGYIPYTLSENDQTYQHESAFEKSVVIPAEYKGNRIVLRINGAVNYSRLWINGKLVSTHRSGKTSWDTDITDFVTPGSEARITIGLTAENPQVDFSRVRGITGDVTLFALPQNHLSRLHVVTDLDSEYKDANLIIQSGILFNQSSSNSEIRFTLTDPDGNSVSLNTNCLKLTASEDNKIVEQTLTNHIDSPIKWDAEHPNLYTLVAELYDGDVLTERASLRFGFREIEVSGKTLMVNGDAVKLRGANITPSSPNIGVAADPTWEREILTKLKAANVNFVRTAHAPFTESFYALCDEMGFYVESEASIFFIGMDGVKHINLDSLKNDSRYADSYLNAVSEMIEEFKSHPSILYWSIGNESNWGSNSVSCHTYSRAADPTRPTKFSWGYTANDIPEIFSVHYGLKSAGTSVPNIWDEYAHGSISVNEEKLDPGYQDCAETIDQLWTDAYQSDSCIGGAIWSANDRMTYTSNGNINAKYNAANGCGWGFLDVWGREKPGYWNVKKAYSPFKISNETSVFANPGAGNSLVLSVENRFNHANLNECVINWKVGAEAGTLSGPNVPKRSSGQLTLPARNWNDGDVLELEVTYQGIIIDEYALSIGKKDAPAFGEEPLEKISVDTSSFLVSGNSFSIQFDSETGLIQSAKRKEKQVLCGGPILNLGTASPGTWTKTNFSIKKEENTAIVTISGKYSSGISATFVLTINGDGTINTHINADNIPADYNELGVAYIAPSNVESLMWKRNGYWSTYPEDHLGRNEGIAMKNYENGYYRPANMPDSTWAEDMQNYFLFGDNDQGNRGSNDFRSRKTNYYYAALTFDNGAILYAENKPKEKGTSDGTTASVRAQVLEDGAIRFNLNTSWLQKGNPDWHYTTPVVDISSGYVGNVELHMSDKDFSLICLHENKNHVEAKSATCTQPGTKEHWHCTGCGLHFSDEDCHNVLDSVTVPTVSHILTGSDAKGTFHPAKQHQAQRGFCNSGSHV